MKWIASSIYFINSHYVKNTLARYYYIISSKAKYYYKLKYCKKKIICCNSFELAVRFQSLCLSSRVLWA